MRRLEMTSGGKLGIKQSLKTWYMSLTFPHYERARVHPQNKAVQEMILGGVQPCPFIVCFFVFLNLPFYSDGVFCISKKCEIPNFMALP